MKNCGIYKITNQTTKRFYIGSSKEINSRWADHLIRLRLGKHVNYFLQSDFNTFGESDFVFEILEFVDASLQLITEQKYLDLYKPFWPTGYNISDVTGGGDFKFHPKREEIYQKYFTNNIGQSNPFHGKKHSEETLRKMRLAAQNRNRRTFLMPISESEKTFVLDSYKEIHSVKGIVKLETNNGMCLGRTKVRKILNLIPP